MSGTDSADEMNTKQSPLPPLLLLDDMTLLVMLLRAEEVTLEAMLFFTASKPADALSTLDTTMYWVPSCQDNGAGTEKACLSDRRRDDDDISSKRYDTTSRRSAPGVSATRELL